MSHDLDHPGDPLLERLGAANPISERAFAGTALPPLGPLPARAPSPEARRRATLLGTASLAVALGVAVVLALLPASVPGGGQVLQRALAAGGGQSLILHWRSRVVQDGIPTHTDDAYLHVTADGEVDRLRTLRVDGPSRGAESVVTQPNGIGNLDGALDRSRRTPTSPIRAWPGYGLPNIGFAAVVATVRSTDRDLSGIATAEVHHDGRAAYAIILRDPKHNPAVPSPDGGPGHPAIVTVWIARDDYTPLGVRYADDRGRTFLEEKVLAFERLPDDAEHRGLLEFGG